MSDLFRGIVPFVAAADEGGFTAAAARLGVTAAAVSKAIRQLEADLGVRLFDRTTRRVELTAEGRRFLVDARAALAAIEAGRTAMQVARDTPEGPVRLSASPVFGDLLAAALPTLIAAHPRLKLLLQLTDRFVSLAEERIDIALRVGGMADSSLISRRVCASRMITCAAPAYLQRAGVPTRPDDLEQHTCLVFCGPSGRPTRWLFADRAPLRVDGAVEMDDGNTIVAACRAGAGVAQAMDFMMAHDLARGSLVEVLGHVAAAGPPIHAVSLPGRAELPRVRVVLDWLSAVMSAQPG